MTKPAKLTKQSPTTASSTSPLAIAATSLDAELRRYFDLTAQTEKIPLNSQKNLERAARSLQDAAASQDRVAGHVRALFEAITVARTSQEQGAIALAKYAEHMATRAAVLGELLEKFAALGVEAKELNAMMQQAASYKNDPYTADDTAAKTRIQETHARMEQVAANAQALSALADEKDMGDIARQADSLRQQILSARNKLTLLTKSLT